MSAASALPPSSSVRDPRPEPGPAGRRALPASATGLASRTLLRLWRQPARSAKVSVVRLPSFSQMQ